MTDANKEAVDATKASHKTLASEYVFGIKVAAYDEDIETPYGPVKRYCSHWSTPGKGAVNVRRLFAEEDVLALLSERDQLRNTLKQISKLPVPGKCGVSGEKWIGWTDEQYEYYCRAWSDFRRKVVERLPEVNQKHTAHNAGLDAAIKCINEFLSSERIGSHEYVKGQTECLLHLRDKINAMKSEGN